MTQVSSQTWCDGVQTRLMAALDDVWNTISSSDDPAVIRRARDKAKALGELAATARRIAGMVASRKPAPARPGPMLAPPLRDPEPPVARKLDKLKGGGRRRL